MKYAYLDKGAILHISESEETAKKYAKLNGKVVPTEIPAEHGYPVVGGEEIIVYSETEMKTDAGSDGCLDASKYSELSKLYSKCR